MVDIEQEVRAVLEAALRVLEEAEVPAELRGPDFEFVLATLASPLNPRSTSRAVGPIDTAERDWVTTVAVHLGLADAQPVEDALWWDGDQLELTITRSALDSTKAQAQREAAVIAIGALEELTDGWVGIDAIRDACQDLGVYDRNLAANLRALGAGLRVRGRGSDLSFRLAEPGRQMAAELLRGMGA